MKIIKEIKLKQDFRDENIFIPKNTKLVKITDCSWGLGYNEKEYYWNKIFQEIDITSNKTDLFDVEYVKELKFKIGDYVKVEKKIDWYIHKDAAIGKVFEIKDICGDEYILSYCKNCCFSEESLELIEIKKVIYELSYYEDVNASSSINIPVSIERILKNNYNNAKNLIVKKL